MSAAADIGATALLVHAIDREASLFMFNMASKHFPKGFSRFPSHRYDRSRPLKSNCPNFPLRLSKNKSPAEEAGLGRSKRMALGRHRTSVRVPSNHKVPLPYTAANGPYPIFPLGVS